MKYTFPFRKTTLLTLSLMVIVLISGCLKMQNSITKLHEEIATKDKPENMVILTNEPQDRILIERDKISEFESELPDLCDFEAIEAIHFYSQEETQWGSAIDPETDWVIYKNQERGLEISIPYNPEWGSPKYFLNPYDEYDNGLSFGTINSRGEGCGLWYVYYRLNFLPAKNKEDILKQLQKESDTLEFGHEINVLSIDGKDIIKYDKDGMCGGGGTIIIGKKYNYELTTGCGSLTREDIIKTIKFIE